MARHNREAQGEDQRGHQYTVEYQPDWLHQIKVTRDLDSGRQSTKTLFRNSDPPLQEPGPKVRARITCADLGIDLQVSFTDERQTVRKITLEATIPEGPEQGEVIMFSLTRRRRRTPSS